MVLANVQIPRTPRSEDALSEAERIYSSRHNPSVLRRLYIYNAALIASVVTI